MSIFPESIASCFRISGSTKLNDAYSKENAPGQAIYS